jgi:hypothetical protein
MELSGLLSNPQLAGILSRLQAALTATRFAPADAPVPATDRRRPQGQVLRMIKSVLREHRDGLPATEVRRLVELRLGRELPRSTVKGALAEHSGPDGSFRRRKRGIYAVRGA